MMQYNLRLEMTHRDWFLVINFEDISKKEQIVAEVKKDLEIAKMHEKADEVSILCRLGTGDILMSKVAEKMLDIEWILIS